MIFQHTWQQVLDGTKTQTRRLVKAGEFLLQIENPFGGWLALSVFCQDKRTLARRNIYAVGQTYAVQPGRGKPAIARICITDIRREDVRQISEDDARAEGFQTASDFFVTWCKMHDKGVTLPIIPDYDTGSIVWQGVRSELQARPAARYDAWVLTFCLVKDGDE